MDCFLVPILFGGVFVPVDIPELVSNPVKNNPVVVSTWDFGQGNVYFLSDSNGTIGKTNFTSFAEDITVSFMRGFCNEPNTTSIDLKKLATLNRYVNYNSNAVKMVIYTWK